MNWKTAATIAATILILPFGINAVEAQNNSGDSMMEWSERNKHEGKWGMRGGITRLTEQLDLTPEQTEQIEAISERSKTDNQALVEQLQTNRQEMRSLLTNNASAEELRTNHQDLQNLQQELGNNRFETMLEIREILTPEQRTQMAELMEQRGGRKFGRN